MYFMHSNINHLNIKEQLKIAEERVYRGGSTDEDFN